MKTKSKYFDGALSANFVSLFTGRMLMYVASGLLGLFLPIFLFELFDKSYIWVFIFYGCGSLIYAVSIPFGVKLFDKNIERYRQIFVRPLIIGDKIFIYYFYPETLLDSLKLEKDLDKELDFWIDLLRP